MISESIVLIKSIISTISESLGLFSKAKKYHTQNKSIPKRLTDPPPRVNKNQFIARDKQVPELKAKIKSGKNLALISGFGGVGKTTIARTYTIN